MTDDEEQRDADPAPGESGGPYAEVMGAVSGLISGYRHVASQAGGLAALEARLAANAAMRMLGAGVFAAIVAAAAWLLVQAAGFVWLVDAGLSAVAVLLGLALLNLFALWLLTWYVKRLSRLLTFMKTRQLVLGEMDDERAEPSRESAV